LYILSLFQKKVANKDTKYKITNEKNIQILALKLVHDKNVPNSRVYRDLIQVKTHNLKPRKHSTAHRI